MGEERALNRRTFLKTATASALGAGISERAPLNGYDLRVIAESAAATPASPTRAPASSLARQSLKCRHG
jgi:hypothetical protein